MVKIKDKIKDLDLQGLKDVLKEVKLYRTLEKQLGGRGRGMYERQKKNTKLYIVEYFPSVGIDLAWEEANKVYSKVFDVSLKQDEVQFQENSTLLGGIKVFADDKMVDLSYDKIEKQIK